MVTVGITVSVVVTVMGRAIAAVSVVATIVVAVADAAVVAVPIKNVVEVWPASMYGVT